MSLQLIENPNASADTNKREAAVFAELVLEGFGENPNVADEEIGAYNEQMTVQARRFVAMMSAYNSVVSGS